MQNALRQKRNRAKERKEVPVVGAEGLREKEPNLQGSRGVGKGVGFYPKNHNNYLRSFRQRSCEIAICKSPLCFHSVDNGDELTRSERCSGTCPGADMEKTGFGCC